MFKITFATATALLVAATFGASAHAGGSTKGTGGTNGTSMNGMGLNGVKSNAITSNALNLNGWQNGIEVNGTAPVASSFAIDGIELPAQVR